MNQNLTRFFMPDELPVRTGTYQAMIDFKVPHPKHRDELQIYANWDGQEWRGFNGKKVKIQAWRGLDKSYENYQQLLGNSE